jgi:LacI family transcriptional regulator
MASQRDRRAREATRDDVARLAGVSSAVVSYVVNDGPRPVAPGTRARVLEAIQKLGYCPNSAARALITGQSRLLGLIVPDIENPYFAGLAKAVEKEGASRGFRLVLTQCTSENLPDMVDSLAGHQVDGIITATLPPRSLLSRASWARIPMVNLSLAMPLGQVPALCPDFYGGSQSAVRHLVEVHQHKRVGLVTGSEQLDERERGWRDILEGSGLEPGPICRVPWSLEGGCAAARDLAAVGSSVEAVFVASDQQAVGLLAGLHRLGIRVPSDLAVVSFDGSLSSEFTIPSLTTMSLPFADMATDAIDELLGAPATNRTYPTTLILRESCGCDVGDRPEPSGAVALSVQSTAAAS